MVAIGDGSRRFYFFYFWKRSGIGLNFNLYDWRDITFIDALIMFSSIRIVFNLYAIQIHVYSMIGYDM